MTTNTTLPEGSIVKVTKDADSKYLAMTPDGTDVTAMFENHQLRRAVEDNVALKATPNKNGEIQWRNCPLSEFNEITKKTASGVLSGDGMDDHKHIVDFLRNGSAIRPSWYKMDDLKWRFAVRAGVRGKNLLITGPRGAGKTVLGFALAEALERPFYNVPLGSTQDPRSVIIGNTHFKGGDENGTFVALSYFAEAIQKPNAIILLDELSRAHPDAWNLLMPVLDYKQRYLRVDEAPDTPTIKVAPGVTFLATANIGSSYTATRTLDAALFDRFLQIEVDHLDRTAELEFLTEKFVPAVNSKLIEAVVNIAHGTRQEAKNIEGRITDAISTRNTIEMSELLYDGFTLAEALETAVYPHYLDAGPDGPRAYVKSMAQKFMPTSLDDTYSPFAVDPDDDNLPWNAPSP